MHSVAIIGGGISGLSMAHCLKDRFDVKVFEAAEKPGGLIKCDRIQGHLYHIVGGHVFNSRRKDVLDWFWDFFNQENEFTKAERNAAIYFEKPIGYPIENHIYELPPDVQKKIIADLLKLNGLPEQECQHFDAFLKQRFGETLYQLYFKPYNEKIWKTDLSNIPLTWLNGKLPMPTIEEILFNNFYRQKEAEMVHSSFFYAKQNGSQFLANRLAEGLNIKLNTRIETLHRDIAKKVWTINGAETFDKVVFTGNIRFLPELLGRHSVIEPFENDIKSFEYHGTTTVLCEVDKNDFSWVYLPDEKCLAHRIICTCNFSESNNIGGKLSATIEFTDRIEDDEILKNLALIPFKPQYITHTYTEYTYPIQNAMTKEIVKSVKSKLVLVDFYLLGRFAEWEYYNMDAAIGAAIDLSKSID